MTASRTQELSAGTPDATEAAAPSRARFLAVFVVVVIGSVSALGAFAAQPVRSVAYVLSIAATTAVVLATAKQHARPAHAWWFLGVGAAVWMLGGLMVELQIEAQATFITDLSVSIAYAVGYLPVMIGFAELADPQLHTRRLSSILDGVILFLLLYAVLWLLVVEQVAVDTSLPLVDRAFQSVYPAGDVAVLMLAVRVVAGRTVQHNVGVLLVVGAVLNVVADVGLLVAYLRTPYGSFPIYDFVYLIGLGCFALAGVLSLLPGPPAVPTGEHAASQLPVAVAVATVLPALTLGGIVWFTDRTVSPAPIAVWLFVTALAAVLRNVAGMRELERAHQHSLWLASHDFETDMLRRSAFLHEMSEGRLRDRSGTVIVVEIGGLTVLADRRGLDASDRAIDVSAIRLVAAAGEGAVLARLAHDQFAVFLRSMTLGRGRQVAAAVQAALMEPVPIGEEPVQLAIAVGVAQADGAVIDVLAGVRRATEAMRFARRQGPGQLAVDADLTGTVNPVMPQSGVGQR
ncbi:MAG: GGDEF domain-containing protein [Actinomycetota bacterium]|nr:GGDEF domain-containing protein [Actinomycetota bacterium]